MGLIQRDAFRTMLISYFGMVLGYLNKGVLFIIILSTEQIGLVNLLASVGFLYAQLSSLGALNTSWKFFSFFRNSERDNYGFLKLMLTIVAVGSLLALILTFVLERFITEYYQDKSSLFVEYYYWIIPIGTANILFLLFETHLRAMFKNVLSVFVNEIGLRLIVFVLLGALYYDFLSFPEFLVINCLVYFIPALILFIYLIYLKEIKSFRVKIQVPKRFRKIVVKYGLYSYANSLGTVTVTTLDATMIASMVGLSGTGVYTTIMYLTSALQVPYRALFRISSPFVPVYWKERKMKEMATLYKDVSSVSLIMGSAFFLLVWLNRVEIFSLFPSEFQSGIWVFLFLILGKLFDMYMGINSTILLTSKKYRIDMLFTIILLLLVFTLNYWLIPIYGIIGAAISTMVATVVYNLLRMLYVWWKYKIHPFRLNHLIIILLIAATLVVSECLPTFSDNIFITVTNQTLEVLFLFILPVVVLRVEPQINGYLNKLRKRKS